MRDRFGNLLVNPLMRTAVIEKGDTLADHALSMTFTEDQEMVEEFTTYGTEEAFAQGIINGNVF
jgi:hypothetical protein